MCNEEERNSRRFGQISDESVWGANTRVTVDSELSEELEAKVGMYQGSVLSSFISKLW